MKNIIRSKLQKKTRFLYVLIVLILGSVFLNIFISENATLIEPDFKVSKSLLPPLFSSESGFYKNSFALSLSSSYENAKILYTLDGSKPKSGSFVYSEPIIIDSRENDENTISEIPTSPRWLPPLKSVSKAFVVRAVVVYNSDEISEIVTHTYFIQGTHSAEYTLPVVSIVTDNINLFDYKKGIYVMGKMYENKSNYIKENIPLNLPWWRYPANYNEHGKNSYRPVNIEFFEKNKTLGFSVSASARVSGNATRGYAQKSLSIYFNKNASVDILKYKLFETDTTSSFKHFALKNGGNDWNKTLFRDLLMQTLMNEMGLDAPSYRSVIVFINGEYWGIHQMCERMNEDYVGIKYGLDPQNIKIVKYLESSPYGNKFDDSEYMNLLEFVKNNDLSLPQNYSVVKSRIDVKNYIDYVVSEVFFANSDWPHNNFMFWRYIGPSDTDSLLLKQEDGKFRWLMTDFDFGYGGSVDVDYNMLTKTKEDFLFSHLILNAEFKELFLDRFKYQLENTFQPNIALAKIDSISKVLSPEMQEHIDRWRVIVSVQNWNKNIDLMRNFAEKRPGIQAQQLNDFFGLKGSNRIDTKKQ